MYLGLEVDREEAVAHGGHHEGDEAEPDGGDQHHLTHRGLHINSPQCNQKVRTPELKKTKEKTEEKHAESYVKLCATDLAFLLPEW